MDNQERFGKIFPKYEGFYNSPTKLTLQQLNMYLKTNIIASKKKQGGKQNKR